MGVRIQELPETTGINKEDLLIVEDGQGTKKGTVQQLDEALGVSQLKEDLVNQKKEIDNSKKVINELNDKKITKFYASNQGEIHITDSDNGKIQDLKIYGQSKQDGEPSPSNPVEIKNVVNPKMSVCGSNILQKDAKKHWGESF